MYAIGIDIGGTNTDMGLVRNDGTIIERRNLKTSQYTIFSQYVNDLAEAIRSMIETHSIDMSQIEGIGIGAPNGNFYTGCVENAMNLTMHGVLNFEKEMAKHFSLPVVLSNDANAAAYGEYVYGGAKGMKNFIMFTLGTGVGSGIVIDGRLVLGSTGAAGELGHAIVMPDGRQCSCGLHGCIEAYAASRGILQTYAELRAAYDALHKPETHNFQTGWIDHTLPLSSITSKNLGDAANAGDPLAVQTFEITGRYLGLAMANAVAFSSPEAIFLMGGPAQVGEPLLRPLRESFESHLLYGFKGTCQIRMSQLTANNVAILGAAALIKMK
ncbi:MAG: ROK family protein [Bacteroidales bacterium]|nr:ROK family protein [Bacteroidales bacterium]